MVSESSAHGGHRNTMSAVSYDVKTQVFEGPLQLLLELITSRRVEITELSLTDLVNEYLAYLDLMRQLDLEVTSEFLVIATTLIQLKARRLLPDDGGKQHSAGGEGFRRRRVRRRDPGRRISVGQSSGRLLREGRLRAPGDSRHKASQGDTRFSDGEHDDIQSV